MSKALYTIRRCNSNKKNEEDRMYGPSHGSADGEYTICGQILNCNWYITNNTFDGEITCKKCIKKLQEQPYSEL